MDCPSCIAHRYYQNRPICETCYEVVKSIITFTNNNVVLGKSKSTIAVVSPSNSSKGLAKALQCLNEMKEIKENEEELNDKLTFLGGFFAAYRDQIHTDIQVKTGNNGPPIPAHRALLATRSDIFKNMLDSDECKAPLSNDTIITLPELNHEELESLLEVLYSGSLPKEKMEKHLYSLSVAADKYDIPFLHKLCEQQLLGSLSSSNALDVIEFSDVCSSQALKETALKFIIKNMEDIVFSARFDAFALKNPHLTVQITRASFMDLKNRTK